MAQPVEDGQDYLLVQVMSVPRKSPLSSAAMIDMLKYNCISTELGFTDAQIPHQV